MALPSSGQISISSSAYASSTQIASETVQNGKAVNYSLTRLSRGSFVFGSRDSNSYTGLNQNSTTKPDRETQHSLTEFYSYNHTQNGSCSGTSFGDVLANYSDDRYSYHRIEITGGSGYTSVISISVPAASYPNSAKYEIYTTYPFNSYGVLTGTPTYQGFTGASSRTDTYYYIMTASSEVLHIVAYCTSAIL
jgi:hypothetical protein